MIFNSSEDNDINEQKIKDSLFNSYTIISGYFKKIISFEDIYFSIIEILKILFFKGLFNILNEKLVLFIILNVIIFYYPIENYCEHFVFKIKVTISITIASIISLIIVFIPKYEQPKEKEGEKDKQS